MSSRETIQVETAIIGGGAAGLWLLDELTRRGCAALLLESRALGSGQTIASQGIIHGGLKYTLKGAFTRSAGAIAEMPTVWRDCLAGRRKPDLQNTIVRSQFCHLWRTESITSKLGMIGARVGLRVKPVTVAPDDRPAVLADCPGTVQRIDEQVIDPASFLADLLHQHRTRIFKIDPSRLRLSAPSSPQIAIDIETDAKRATIATNHLILTAGEGNPTLRELLRQTGFKPVCPMQRRPLHMVMLRGDPRNLPELNGHCVDGARTRVTITTARDRHGRNIWQVGGQIAEDGVTMEPRDLIGHARRELHESLAGFELHDVEWSTYRVDRAEATTSSGARPDDVAIIDERTESGARVITAWPTKLALVPRLAEQIADAIPRRGIESDLSAFADWPRPDVALPPWETQTQWFADA